MAGGEGQVDGVEIRKLTELADYERTLEIQSTVWGFSDRDQVPPRMFTVSVMIGGLALGMFREDRMIGFSLSMPGKKADGSVFLHSHMTGLLDEEQGRGLGYRLKLRQRDEALALGYEVIEWTFDPLATRNAYFNIMKLGVTARRYEPNAYGITSSTLHGGTPTDRLVAEWRLKGRDKSYGPVVEEIEVPVDVRSSVERALEVQADVRQRFQELFAAGYEAISLRRSESGGRYGLARPID